MRIRLPPLGRGRAGKKVSSKAAGEVELRPVSRKSKERSSLAEEDVIDGFLILSFMSYQDLESEMKGAEDTFKITEPDILVESQQPDEDSKDDEETGNAADKPVTELINGNHITVEDNKAGENVGENNNEPNTPNQNILRTSPKKEPLNAFPVAVTSVRVALEKHPILNCDTADEEKKVPPDLETTQPETPKQDETPVASKPPSSPYPLKSPHFQNGPLQQPEPSTAVAAVTVTASAASNPATVPTSDQRGTPINQTPLPSSTSPAGGVPFPSSLLNQEEYSVSAAAVCTVTKTGSPVLVSKNYDSSLIKSHRGSNSDVVHSVPYPISSSYSDYTVNYSTSQYPNKHSHTQETREATSKAHHQKYISNNYYHHPQQQQIPDKYAAAKDASQRNGSKTVVQYDSYKADNYVDTRYENKPTSGADLNYCVAQAYSNDKNCDPQLLYKKANPNSVYNYKRHELANSQSAEAALKSATDKTKAAADCYPSVSKAKIPNRTTYYQSIVNKTHSRHKSSRRVLPASAYETQKQNTNSYPTSKPDTAQQQQAAKPAQYASHHYPTDPKKAEYYQHVSAATAHVSNSYNYSGYKSEQAQQSRVSSSTSHHTWADPSISRSYKSTTEQYTGSYKEKQVANSSYSSSTKNYSYYQNAKNYPDGQTKAPVDSSGYAANDYYSKGNVNYSRNGSSHNSVEESYKNSNHVVENTSYVNKHANYQYPRAVSEKTRNYYPNQEVNCKNYQSSNSVPKSTTDEAHNYKSHNDVNPYANYANANAVKHKEALLQNLEVQKPIAKDQVAPSRIESNQNSHPVVCEANAYYSSAPYKDKDIYYPYAESSHSVHRKTPPPTTKPQSSFQPLSLPAKDTESFRVATTTTAISTYSQAPSSASPITVYDSPRNSTKTLWSPTATVTTVTSAPSRENIAAPSRDSHSSHSNSSISSLSQLSQSLSSGAPAHSQFSSKEYSREGRSSSNGHSRCSSQDDSVTAVTSASSTPTTTTTASTATYGVSGSLTSLIFSKPSWTSPSSSSVLSNPGSHLTPPSSSSPVVPSVLPLAPSLPGAHHSSPFGHPAAGPHVMFAPPLPTAGSLSSPSLPLATAAGPAPFATDPLLVPPTGTDLLRRELDTRFLASQDRSINVPPPPYLRTEMHQHQHQHTHMHQHSPFLPPPIGGSLLPPTAAAHLYDKFPKPDPGIYGRNALGLPGYPSLSPLLAPGSAAATATPFAPPGHLAAFQPKISPLVKTKPVKSGRWCAMHVRISWEIYHHQQKNQAESQKGGNGTATKGMPELLRSPNHLFGSLPRPHELGFSSPLLTSAASFHGRSPYDVTPQHPSFLGPTPAHLGISPFARPNYPGLGVPGNSFGGLGSLVQREQSRRNEDFLNQIATYCSMTGYNHGLTGAGMLTGRELGPGYLGVTQDPWGRLHRNFPSPSSVSPAAWGGLKAEAQRREEQEREKVEKIKKAEQEKRDKESEKSKEREKREQEKQKERDRESRTSHIPHSSEVIRNGEPERSREREWERGRERERREASRSPIRSTHKTDDAFDRNPASHKPDVKVKEEKKEEEQHAKETTSNPDRERTKSSDSSALQEQPNDYRGILPGLPMALSASEQGRLPGALGVPPPHFWNPLPPPPPQTTSTANDRYRSLELQHDREQLMQKYAALSSVMPLVPDRYREAELARHLSPAEVERQLQADRDRQVYERTKLPPPPLRPNDPPYVPPAGGLFSSLSNPFLNTLCSTNYPPRTKPGSPSALGNGIPPPLIPCVTQGGSPVTTSTTPSPLHLKLGASSNSSVEGSREHYASKDRHSASEIESQSR